MEDDEVPAAGPATEMGDRRQRAPRDRLVRSLDASRTETQALGDPRESQEIRAVALECYATREVRIVGVAVIGRDGRQRRQAAVVASALADEGELSRRD